MPRTLLRVLIAAALLLATNAATVVPVLAAACDTSTTALLNGGFENPGTDANNVELYDASLVPPWHTTDSAGQIEIWGDGFNGVPAGEGGSFAELNANSAGTLYQDVVTTPGESMHWSLLHRARVGTDVMQVLIGNASTADPTGSSGWDFVSAGISDDTSAWGSHASDYVVPPGQTCTRFAFRAISSGAGDDSFGNFLDAVTFSIPVAPTPTPTRTRSPKPTTLPTNMTEPPTDTASVAPASEPATSTPLIVAVAGVLAAAVAGRAAFVRTRGRRGL